MPEQLLTMAEAALRLQVTVVRAYQLVREGILPAVRLGRQIRVDPRRLDDFVRKGGAAFPGGWRRLAAKNEEDVANVKNSPLSLGS